ncbi:unnamed protein product [Linum tenue]|uniref:Uncharacterized protein n=1 Tax=Linum tenue TaxID=586396 RepID=A0AAV0QXL1_9ROSI|nr:unnamed protein product [Linum tenue]
MEFMDCIGCSMWMLPG